MKSETDMAPLMKASRSIKRLTGKQRGEVSKLDGGSHSGNEPNNLFLNVAGTKGRTFVDTSGLSGLDALGDGRVLVRWDPNGDGRVDLAVINANRPLLQLFENHVPSSHGFVALRLVGGRRADEAGRWSNRDGIGARIVVRVGDRELHRERRAGDGFAGQSSATLLVGLGEARTANLEVRWPSGRRTTIPEVASGKLVIVLEREESGVSHRVEDYRARPHDERSLLGDASPPLGVDLGLGGEASLRLVVATATWCDACTRALPQVALLRRTFADRLAIYGAPIDPEDDASELEAYRQKHAPAYEPLNALPADRRAALRRRITELVGQEVVPTSLVLDRQGRVLDLQAGIPSVSMIRRWLDRR